MGCAAISSIHSAAMTFGALTPMKTSAPCTASRSVPVSSRGLVRSARERFAGERAASFRLRMPSRSQTTMSRAPAASSNDTIAEPAAPPPLTAMWRSSMRFPTHRKALRSAARTTIAVPCWSSWKTGMSSSSRSRASTSKHRGAAMSSRLIPPNPGAMSCTARTISSTSWVSKQIGHASMLANRLNSAALPSMTGIAARGPMLPRPSTALPSVTTATELPLTVNRETSCGFSAIAMLTRPTPGV